MQQYVLQSLSSKWHCVMVDYLYHSQSEYLQCHTMLTHYTWVQWLDRAFREHTRLVFWNWRRSPQIIVYLPPPIQQVCTPTPRLFWGSQMTKCVNPYPVPTWSLDSHQVYLKLEECLIRMLQLSENMIKYFTLKIWGASFRSWLSGLHASLLSRAHNSNTEQIIQPGINFF